MDIVYAKFTGHVAPSVQIIEGEAWRADDPVVKSRPDWFSPLPKVVRTTVPNRPAQAPVEQATAAPGEKRLTRADAAFDETDRLRTQLAELGVTVDGRWGLARLREEHAKATHG